MKQRMRERESCFLFVCLQVSSVDETVGMVVL